MRKLHRIAAMVKELLIWAMVLACLYLVLFGAGQISRRVEATTCKQVIV